MSVENAVDNQVIRDLLGLAVALTYKHTHGYFPKGSQVVIGAEISLSCTGLPGSEPPLNTDELTRMLQEFFGTNEDTANISATKHTVCSTIFGHCSSLMDEENPDKREGKLLQYLSARVSAWPGSKGQS